MMARSKSSKTTQKKTTQKETKSYSKIKNLLLKNYKDSGW